MTAFEPNERKAGVWDKALQTVAKENWVIQGWAVFYFPSIIAFTANSRT